MQCTKPLSNAKWLPWFSGGHLLFAAEGQKMMETVTRRVAVRLSGRGDAIGNHLFGLVRIIRARFLGMLARQANGVMVENRKDPLILSLEDVAATPAMAGTRQLLFPLRFHSGLQFSDAGIGRLYCSGNRTYPMQPCPYIGASGFGPQRAATIRYIHRRTPARPLQIDPDSGWSCAGPNAGIIR
jgi:hypothetical protein